MSAVAAGSLIAASSAPAAAARANPNFTIVTGGVVVTPATNLANGQKVSLSIKGFSGDTTLFAAECSAAVASKQSFAYCDKRFITLKNVKGGKATASFTVRGGTGFEPTNPTAKCGFGVPQCLIVVADSTVVTSINKVAFAGLTFKDSRPATKTKVTSKKTVKVHKSLTIKVATTHAKGTAKPTGTVTIRDNGKKIASHKEATTGKLTFKHKFKKAGKQHIKVTYSGDKNYKPSSAKETVTVKK